MTIIKRKSPYKHRVSEHTRLGTPVQSYMRGKGKKPKPPLTRSRSHTVVGRGNPKSIGNPKPSGGSRGFSGFFTVTFRYPRGPSETFDQPASTYGSAINPALQRRKTLDDPKLMKLREIK